jgi:hypothetical protein
VNYHFSAHYFNFSLKFILHSSTNRYRLALNHLFKITIFVQPSLRLQLLTEAHLKIHIQLTLMLQHNALMLPKLPCEVLKVFNKVCFQLKKDLLLPELTAMRKH